MACRREGISPCVLAQPGCPASSGSVTLHDHGFGSRGRLVMCMMRPMMRPLEQGDAIGPRLGLREGALPGDVGVGHCHARANFQTGSLVALVSGNGDGPRSSLGTAAAIPGSS